MNEVLRQRAITGVIFSILVVTLFISGKYGAALIGLLISTIGATELANMYFPSQSSRKTTAVFLVYIIHVIVFSVSPDSTLFLVLILISLLSVVLLTGHIFVSFLDFKKHYYGLLIFYLALPLSLFISFVLNSDIYCYLFWLVVIGLIWMTDSMAYLVGSRWGRKKLFERISPKKTWEGFLGAGAITIAVAWCTGGLLLDDPSKFYFVSDWCVQNSGLFIALISVVVWIIGTLGDLFESCLKRYFNVKDSGHFMPGHGGMLDRFDSFIFILPFILLLLLIL